MSKLTLILNTTTERLAAWLQSAPYENFPTECGHLGLNPPRPTAQDPPRPGRRVIEWPTYYEGKSEAVWTVPPAIRFEVQELATERVQVVAECTQDVVEPYFAGLLRAIAQTWPEATENVNRWLSETGLEPIRGKRAGRTQGLHGGTLARVKEAYDLVQGGEPKTRACRRVGIDPRTYDRYVEEVIDWNSEDG